MIEFQRGASDEGDSSNTLREESRWPEAEYIAMREVRMPKSEASPARMDRAWSCRPSLGSERAELALRRLARVNSFGLWLESESWLKRLECRERLGWLELGCWSEEGMVEIGGERGVIFKGKMYF